MIGWKCRKYEKARSVSDDWSLLLTCVITTGGWVTICQLSQEAVHRQLSSYSPDMKSFLGLEMYSDRGSL